MRQAKKTIQRSKKTQKDKLGDYWVKNLDIMGEKFKFQYTRAEKAFKTRLGGIVTLIVGFISFLALIFFSFQYFDTTSPVVTTTRELSRSPQSINLYGQNMFLPVSVSQNRNSEPLKMNNFITVIGRIMKKSFDPQTNSTKTTISKQFNYVPCPEVTEDQSLLDLAARLGDNADLRIYLCPNFKEINNDVTISYDPENLSSSYISIKVYPCILPDLRDCYPPEKVFGAEYSYGLVSQLISPSNYENPLEFRWLAIHQLIDLTRTKSFRYIFEQNKIFDDRKFLGRPQMRAEYPVFQPLTSDTWERDMTQIYCTTAMIAAGECQEYMEFVYEMNNEVVISTRKYKKIPALLGEFGGILKLLTSVFVILSFYYTKAIKTFLFNKVFGVEKSKAKKIMKRAAGVLKLKAETLKSHGKMNEQPQLPPDTCKDDIGGISFKKKIQKKQRIDPNLKEAVEACVDSKTDITDLVKEMNVLEIFNDFYLEKHHQTLLPLVLLKSEQSIDETKKSVRLSSKKIIKETEFEKCFSEENDQEEEQSKNPAENQSIKNTKNRRSVNEDKFHYFKLKNSLARNGLSKILKEELLCYLSLVYEHN